MDSTQPMARPLHLFFPDICAAYSLSIPGRPKHFLTYKYKACYSRVYLSHLPTSDHLKKHPGHLSSFSAPSHPQITYLSMIMLDLGSFIISDTDSFMILFFLLALRLCTSPNAHTDCALYGPCVMSCLFLLWPYTLVIRWLHQEQKCATVYFEPRGAQGFDHGKYSVFVEFN